MDKSEFLIKKYELIYGLFKDHLNLLTKRNEIFVAIQTASFYAFFSALNMNNMFIPLLVAFVFLILSNFWLIFNKKTRLFLEFGKQHMREVEAELNTACNEFKLDIFANDQSTFKTKSVNEFKPHIWNNTMEKFPPKGFEKDYYKYRKRSTSKYETYIPIVFSIAWFCLILYLLYKSNLCKIKHFYFLNLSNITSLLLPIGFILNFIATVTIIFLLESAICSLPKSKCFVKWIMYTFFVLGFLFQILGIINMFSLMIPY